MFAFTLWYDDAAVLTDQFKWVVSTNDLISLPKYTAYTRLMVDWISSDPFSITTLPPFKAEWDIAYIEKIRKQSRQRYAMERWQLEDLMNAWNKKSFSAQEKIAEQAKYEWLGLSEVEAKNLQDFQVQQNIKRFSDAEIDWKQADALIVDTEQWNNKMIWYNKPEKLEEVANLQMKKWSIVKLDSHTKIKFYVEIWQHKSLTCTNKKPLAIWIWSKEEVYQQLKEIYEKAWFDPDKTDFLKFVPNIELLESKMPKEKKGVSKNTKSWQKNNTVNSDQWGFTVDDIKLWEEYDWYVKLMYNYWMFVTVKWVEWLLHKKQIVAPDWVEWKKYYNIWDKIRVKAHEFKDINWEKRVVWTQL
jgi:hypothetical protein